MNKIHVVLISVFLSHNAFAAGGSSDGGGNSVVCFDSPSFRETIEKSEGYIPDELISHVTSVEAYDLYAAKLPRGIPELQPVIIPIQDSETSFDYAKRMITRLWWAKASLASNIRYKLDAIEKGSNVINETHGLRRIDDAAEPGYIDASHCAMVTLATQYVLGKELTLHLDSRLFFHEKHSHLIQGVLLLHEAFYAYSRDKLNESDSRREQAIIGSLITRKPGFTDRQLYEILERFGFHDDSGPMRAAYVYSAMQLITGYDYKKAHEFVQGNPQAARFSEKFVQEAYVILNNYNDYTHFTPASPSGDCFDAANKLSSLKGGWKSISDKKKRTIIERMEPLFQRYRDELLPMIRSTLIENIFATYTRLIQNEILLMPDEASLDKAIQHNITEAFIELEDDGGNGYPEFTPTFEYELDHPVELPEIPLFPRWIY